MCWGFRTACFRVGSYIALGAESKYAGWFPIVGVMLFVCWSWYAYVVELGIYTMRTNVEFGLLLTVYHVLLLGMVAHYYRAVTESPLEIPEKYSINDDMVREMDSVSPEDRTGLLLSFGRKRLQDNPPQMREYHGALRFCYHCKLVKPDRCHHCSTCQQCVLCMDHHCPWINNCVHFGNHKFFLLFLLWGFLFTFFIAVSDLTYAIPIWRSGEAFLKGLSSRTFHVLAMPLFCFPFICITSGFFLTSISILTDNETTLERMGHPIYAVGHRKYFYNQGFRQNFVDMFGTNPLIWLLPVKTQVGDGCHFTTKEFVPLGSPRVDEGTGEGSGVVEQQSTIMNGNGPNDQN